MTVIPDLQPPAEQVKPAEPTPAAPTPPDPLEAVLPDNFEHGFFRGKPVRELFKSFKATESEMQRAQRDAKEQRELAERYRAESVAKDVAITMAAEARTPKPDELDAIEGKWFENPKDAVRMLEDRFSKKFTEQNKQNRAETVQEVASRERTQKFATAMEEARQRLNMDPQTWSKHAKAVVAELTDPQSRYYGDGATQGPLITQNWLDAHAELYPNQPAVTVTPVPQAGNPPGAHKASAVNAPPNAGLPTLSGEKRAALTMIAQRLGFDPESYLTRYQKELQKEMAKNG